MLTQLLVVVLTAAAVQAAQQDGISIEPPAFPQVTNVSFSGSGCSPGTANATWSTANWSDWIVSLHDLNLEATTSPSSSAGRPPSSSDCTIHATFSHPPPGWQLALETVSIRGYAALSSGSSVEAVASTSWSSGAAAAAAAAEPSVERNVSLTNSRPTDQTSAIGALLDFSNVPTWSACSSILSPDLGIFSLNVKYGVHVQANTTGGYAAFGGLVDDGHGEISAKPAVVQHLQWAWRPCTAPVPSMGSTTYLPKPKTTSTSKSTTTTAVTTNSTAWTTTAAANTTTAPTKPTAPFSNSTSVSSTETTTTVKTTVKTTVTVTTTTTTHVLTTPTPVYSNTTTSTKSLPPTTLSTSTRPLANSTWTSLSSTIEPHWTTTSTSNSTTTAPTEFITGSTYQTSVTGTSFSFSFIDDPPETPSTTTPPTTSSSAEFPLITSTPSDWSNITLTEYFGTNSTATVVASTSRAVPLPTQN